MIGMSGHLHDVDITNAGAVHEPLSREGTRHRGLGRDRGRQLQRLLRADPAQQPAAGVAHRRDAVPLRGLLRDAVGRHQVPRPSRHDERVRDPERPAARPHRPRPGPTGGEYSSTGYPFNAGQTIRLHSEYQNNNAQPQTDVMGIMMAWYVPQSPGYPRPKGATPIQRLAGAGLQPVHQPQPGARPARLPGQRVEPRRVLQPAGAELEPAHDRHARRQRRERRTRSGSVKVSVITGNPATTADEADVRFQVSMTDVRCKRRRPAGRPTPPAAPTTRASCSSRRDLRITDRNNGPSEVGTGQDTPFGVTVPCATHRPSTSVGSTCSINTTADAVSARARSRRASARSGSWARCG